LLPAGFDPKRDKTQAARSVYNYVRDKIVTIPIDFPIGFWLSPEEISRIGAADPENKTIFLCSMLRNIDLDARVLVSELSDGSHKALVSLSHQGIDYLLDLNFIREFDDFKIESSKKSELLRAYASLGKKIRKTLYDFNDQRYTAY
jgi:hypothetical protein